MEKKIKKKKKHKINGFERKIQTTFEIDTELLNPLIISQTKQNERRRRVKKGTQALDYSRVTSQARNRHGDSARDGDTYLERGTRTRQTDMGLLKLRLHK